MKNQNKIIGTVAPIFSLQSKKFSQADNGTIKVANLFLTWLHKTGQSAWQIFPLHETGFEKGSHTKRVSSPYKSYGTGIANKFTSMDFVNINPTQNELHEFITENADWIEDYALFCALSDKFGTDNWSSWEEEIKNYKPSAVWFWQESLRQEIQNYIISQWRVHKEFKEFRNEAQKLDIKLIGDLPYYLTFQSPLVWKHQHLFLLEGEMRYVSGYPASKESYFGTQVWGHPLYKWDNEKLLPSIIEFWKLRIRYLSKLFDYIRVDHPVGFFQYGIIDTQNHDNDKFVSGPGAAVFEEIMKYSMDLGLQIIAEEFGEKTSPLYQILEKLNIPGSIIMRWAYNEKLDKLIEYYSKTKEYPKRSVIYSSTHDTETLIGILNKLKEDQKKQMISNMDIEYISNNKELAKRMIKAVIASPSEMILVPIQDWLLLEERLNIPGTEKEMNDPNWQLKLPPIEEFPEIEGLG